MIMESQITIYNKTEWSYDYRINKSKLIRILCIIIKNNLSLSKSHR